MSRNRNNGNNIDLGYAELISPSPRQGYLPVQLGATSVYIPPKLSESRAVDALMAYQIVALQQTGQRAVNRGGQLCDRIKTSGRGLRLSPLGSTFSEEYIRNSVQRTVSAHSQ